MTAEEDSASIYYDPDDPDTEAEAMEWSRVTLGDPDEEPPPATPAPATSSWQSRWGARSREHSPTDAAAPRDSSANGTRPRFRRLRPTNLTALHGDSSMEDLMRALTW